MLEIILTDAELDHRDDPVLSDMGGCTLAPSRTPIDDLPLPSAYDSIWREALRPQLANPDLGYKLIAYVRAQRRDADRSIQSQRQAIDAWLEKHGLVGDEAIVEVASGVRVNDRLEDILRRAERGERIWLLTFDVSRVARDVAAAAAFCRRAKGCGLPVTFVRDGLILENADELIHCTFSVPSRQLRSHRHVADDEIGAVRDN